MKLVGTVLIFLALSVSGLGKEIFVARAISALTKGETVWRVEEARHGLMVRLTHLGTQSTAHLTHAQSQALRARIAGLRLSRADITGLRAREVYKDGVVLLRPFDGVAYRFAIRGGELIRISNPSFDLEHHPDLAEAVRLREVMELLPELARIAGKESGVPSR